jgi:hypothetical protein
LSRTDFTLGACDDRGNYTPAWLPLRSPALVTVRSTRHPSSPHSQPRLITRTSTATRSMKSPYYMNTHEVTATPDPAGQPTEQRSHLRASYTSRRTNRVIMHSFNFTIAAIHRADGGQCSPLLHADNGGHQSKCVAPPPGTAQCLSPPAPSPPRGTRTYSPSSLVIRSYVICT